MHVNDIAKLCESMLCWVNHNNKCSDLAKPNLSQELQMIQAKERKKHFLTWLWKLYFVAFSPLLTIAYFNSFYSIPFSRNYFPLNERYSRDILLFRNLHLEKKSRDFFLNPKWKINSETFHEISIWSYHHFIYCKYTITSLLRMLMLLQID